MSKKMSTWFMTQIIAFRDVTAKSYDMGLTKRSEQAWTISVWYNIKNINPFNEQVYEWSVNGWWALGNHFDLTRTLFDIKTNLWRHFPNFPGFLHNITLVHTQWYISMYVRRCLCEIFSFIQCRNYDFELHYPSHGTVDKTMITV